MSERAAEGAEVLALPLLTLPDTHPCSGCGQCCTYIAVEIDKPTSFQDYDNVHWYLCHKDVSVYIDFEGDWYIEFQTRCEHLSEAATCEIYDDRPRMCSDFDATECEVTTGERAWKTIFHKPDELIEFMRTRRPKAYERYTRMRDTMIDKRRNPGRARRTPRVAASAV